MDTAKIASKAKEITDEFCAHAADLDQVKEALAEAFEDGYAAARRAWKQGRDAAEEFAEDTMHTMKRYPVRTIAITAGVGLAVGVLIGLTLRQRK